MNIASALRPLRALSSPAAAADFSLTIASGVQRSLAQIGRAHV